MLSEKVAQLLIDRIDFTNEELETIVEDALAKGMAMKQAASDLERAIATEFPDDPEAQQKNTDIAEGVVDFANEIGAAFPTLTSEQRGRFKDLFTTVFESESEEIELAGENLFNTAVDALGATQALNDYVAGLLPEE